MRKSTNWAYIEKKDKEFWTSVHHLTFILLHIIGIPGFVQRPHQRPTDGDIRIVAYPERNLPVVAPLCEFFSSSPDYFIPCRDYVCQIRETLTPIAFGKRELLAKLRDLSKESDNIAFITALYSKLDPLFLEADDIDWNESTAMTEKKFQVAQAKMQLERVYRLWVQYVRRHYDHAMLGKNDKAKLDTRIQCIDALRNHIEPDARNPTPVRDMCHVLTLVDDTLCFDGLPDPSKSDCPGGVMGKELLSWMMYRGKIPGNLKSDVIKILQLNQKILVREQKNQGSEMPACFSYWKGNTEYLILHHKDNGKYTYREDHKLYSSFARKNVILQDKDSASDEKEFLYRLLRGNQDGLCELAKLTASCFCTQKIYNGAIVLPSQQAQVLLIVLPLAAGCDPKNMVKGYGISFLPKKATVDELIKLKIEGRLFGFALDDGKQMNAQQWTRLKKIFSGVHITHKDPILGRKMHKNTMQWFVIGNDQTVKKLVNHGIKVKQLPFSLELSPPVPKNSPYLQQILPLWGYLQMQKRSRKDDMPEYRTVQQFIDQCCQITEEKVEFIEAKTLYDCYKAYCGEQGWKGVLKFKDFNDSVEAAYGLKRVRHHYTNGKNPTGFDRITIKSFPDSRDAVPQPRKNKKSEALSSRETFFLKLEQMEQEVRNHFIQYPFD